MAATPKDNTEVVRMLRDVKNSLWKLTTPLKDIDKDFSDYMPSRGHSSKNAFLLPDVATKLNFSSINESQSSERSVLRTPTFETPDSMKRKLMNVEAELQVSKAKLKERESFISVLEPAKKKMCIDLENKLEKYQSQTLIDAQKIEELKSKLRWAKGETTHAKNHVHEIERQRKIDLDKKELQVVYLQQEVSSLKSEMADIKSEKAEAVRKLHTEIGRLQLKVASLNEDTKKSEELIQVLKRQKAELAEKANMYTTLEKQHKDAQSKIKSLENKIEADKDASFIVASRQSDLKLLLELQKENHVLKEEVSKNKENNIALFQEKIWSYQEKLKLAEKKITLFTVLQAENEKLKAKLAQWEDLFDDKNTFKSPTAFSRKLSEYQKNEAVLTNKLSQLSNHCETLEKQKKDMEATIKSLNHKLQQFNLNSPRQDSLIKRLQRKVIFLSKERDNCRKLLDSYLSESTVPGIAQNAEHINRLEEINVDYKKALEKCEKEVEFLNDKIKDMTERNNSDALRSELKKLREEKAAHLSTISLLQKEKASLEQKFSASTVEQEKTAWGGKILHLRFNPVDNANKRYLEAFKKLQEENDVLKKRIKVLEEEGAAADDVTMKVKQKLAVEGSDSTLKKLQEQLTAAERQQRFILENACIKSKEFREAVYRLFGYRIDVPTAETYRLSHVYADSRDDYLLFQINSEGIQLVETEYSKQLTDKVELYLQQHDSFPAFFASLTMDLFSQQTCMLNQ